MIESDQATSTGNPAFSVPVIGRVIGLLVLTWLTWQMIAAGLADPRPGGVITLVDGANFIVHEAGHFIFMVFGEFLAVLGGSLNQVLIPAIFTGYFFWHRAPGSACATLFWTGQSLTGVAIYAADAQALRLPLHGSDGTDAAAIHDWHRLLTWMGLLDRAKPIGDLMFMVAVITMIAALVILTLDLVRVYRHPPPLALVVVLSLLAAPHIGAAPGKMPRVGYLAAGSEASSYVGAFRDGLRELGYVEGRSIAIEYRWGEGHYERLPKLAAELVKLRMDVIVAVNAPAAQAAKDATSEIPVVVTVLLDPVAAGLVTSLARPGGNVTGLSMISAELVGKQLELLKQVLPKISRVAVLGNPANPGTAPQVREAKSAAHASGLQLQLVEARTASEIDAAFAAMLRERAEAVLVLVDAMLGAQRDRIARLAIKNRVPAVSGLTRDAEGGALFGYGANRVDLHHRVATYVDKILKGARPGDMPIEQPTKFELAVNVKTAKALGLTIPPSLLLRAHRVIE